MRRVGAFLCLLLLFAPCMQTAGTSGRRRQRRRRQTKMQTVLESAGRILAPLLDPSQMNPQPGFTSCTDVEDMSSKFQQINGANFDYVVGLVNSMAWCVANGYGGPVADAVWKADVDSGFDNRIIWSLSGIVSKAILDNLLLDRALQAQIEFANYLIGKGRGSDVNPNAGIPITWSQAVLYLEERGATEQAGNVLLSAVKNGGNAADYTRESLNVATLAKTCSAIGPVLESAKRQAASQGVPLSQLQQWASGYQALSACLNTGTWQTPGIDFRYNLMTQDYPAARSWALAILSGSPSGVGPGSAAVNNPIIRAGTRFGIAEKAASALAVQLIQGGAVAQSAMAELGASYDLYGCQPLAVALVDAEGIARAMGVAATFKAELSKDPRFVECLNKGLLAFLYN